MFCQANVKIKLSSLHELWDKMKIGDRCKVEVTTNEDVMEVIIAELMVPTFYFTNEKKFWRQLRCIIKWSLQNEQFLETKIYQLFVSEWKNEYFSQDGTPSPRFKNDDSSTLTRGRMCGSRK